MEETLIENSKAGIEMTAMENRHFDGLLRSLDHWGANTREAMHNMLGDKSFYLDLLYAFLEDNNLCELGKKIENQQYQEAFMMAHTLKGVSANLSLTPIYDVLSRIVEQLRDGTGDKLDSEDVELFFQERDHFRMIMELWMIANRREEEENEAR